MPLDQAGFTEYLKNPLLFPEEFKDYVSDFFATNVPKIHVSQINGFKLQSVRVADDVNATVSLTGTSYEDQGGPSLTGIGNGFYIVMWGCYAFCGSSTGNSAYMSIEVDGVTSAGEHEMLLSGTELALSVGRLTLIDLSQGSGDHTVNTVYKKTSTNTVDVSLRWLHLLKVTFDDSA